MNNFKDFKNLTPFQKAAFIAISERIKGTKTVSINADNELLIWKNTERGLTNIIIHEENDIAFSFISAKGSEEKDIFYFTDKDTDFDKLVEDFETKG